MFLSVATDVARARAITIDVDGQPYTTSEYIGSSPKPGSKDYGKPDVAHNAAELPQAYLVEQPPNSTTRPHFHQTNQFQLFVGGGGRLGKKRVDPLTVQYAGGDTPYGPIFAEEGGVAYFTLRQCWDSGAKYLPERRDLMTRGRQRQRIGVAGGALSEAASGVKSEVLIPPEDDGLLVMRYVIPPTGSFTAPDGAAAGGQYHVVVDGSIERDTTTLGPLSVEWADPSEGEVTFNAGAAGAEVVLLRFPVVMADEA